MIRRIPIIPTIIVVSAVATMIALGLWQLGRADEKEALLTSYAQAGDNAELVVFPAEGEGTEVLYRRSSVECDTVLSIDASAGTSERGAKGWAQKAVCYDGKSDAELLVYLGWSLAPAPPEWDGGLVEGIIGPGPRLVAMPAQAGLEQLARPDPADLPNNHLAYAGQWFFFALTALAIYWLALRRRWKDAPEE
ncbi:MAG: SURF1 family cytochrome oxidase biogenesis protein [Erythrobacter sp.]